MLDLLNLINGRPAQHFQNSGAAVIKLDELIFAQQKLIDLVIDPGTTQAKPDKLFGSKLVLLLSQTAGGIFERRYFQQFTASGSTLYQQTDDDTVVSPQLSYSQDITVGDMETRVTEMTHKIAPYKKKFIEEARSLESGQKVYELKEIQIHSPDDATEFMAISFNSGDNQGIRDLGYQVNQAQKGRFKFRVEVRDGFAYGDFRVSATKNITKAYDATPTYYTSIELTPRFSPDMKNKIIIIHVVHSAEGVYTETQIVPRKIVHPNANKTLDKES